MFDFDGVIDRRGTQSLKWDKYGEQDILPLWVADTDFKATPAIIDALHRRIDHGVFGYSRPSQRLIQLIVQRMQSLYGWHIEKEWLLFMPGVVPGLNFACRAWCRPEQHVITPTPVYYPFFTAIRGRGRTVVENPLLFKDGRFEMDYGDLEKKLEDSSVKLVFLCSPHNPVGRVWSRQELETFASICAAKGVIVISDEIHCDLIHTGHTFTSFASISEEFAQNSIVCTAPSKTFNLPGLKTSNMIIPNRKLRLQFTKTMERAGLMGGNTFGLVGTEAAYRHGEDWLTELLAYIEANYHFIVAYFAEHLPQLTVSPLEGTYLVWVDCRALGLDKETRQALFLEKAKLFLDEGELFGPEGEGFERFNIACPRAILVEALARMKTVITALEPA